jgi:hypothetical protein
MRSTVPEVDPLPAAMASVVAQGGGRAASGEAAVKSRYVLPPRNAPKPADTGREAEDVGGVIQLTRATR